MFTYRKTMCAVVLCVVFLFANASVSSEVRPEKTAPSKIPPTDVEKTPGKAKSLIQSRPLGAKSLSKSAPVKAKSQIESAPVGDKSHTKSAPVNAKSYDLRVSLEISHSDFVNDRYELTATVVNHSKYDRGEGGTLVFSREGHGEPLPARYGEKIDKGQKWGHQRIAERKLPELRAGQSTTFKVKTNGRGDFYAHLEGIVWDNKPKNNRSDTSNLQLSLSTRVDSSVMNIWFFNAHEPPTVASSRLHGSSGHVEIHGLIPRTTFGLPTEVYDYILSVRTKVALAANDINLLADPRPWLGAGKTNAETRFWVQFQWETNGKEFLLGGDPFMKGLYPDVHYVESRPAGPGHGGTHLPFQVDIGFDLKFDPEKQLFGLDGTYVEMYDLAGGLSTDGWTLTEDAGLKRMFEGVTSSIKAKISSAIASKRGEIEWSFNKRMRDMYLTDRFGNSGAIDWVKFNGGEFNWRIRTPTRVSP